MRKPNGLYAGRVTDHYRDLMLGHLEQHGLRAWVKLGVTAEMEADGEVEFCFLMYA